MMFRHFVNLLTGRSTMTNSSPLPVCNGTLDISRDFLEIVCVCGGGGGKVGGRLSQQLLSNCATENASDKKC